MGAYKLKVRIGQHEFEAEGPQEIVEKQFAAFSQLITQTKSEPVQVDQREDQEGPESAIRQPNGSLARIFHAEGKNLSLSALPPGNKREGDAALLILLGHKVLRSSDLVTGEGLLAGLKQSGYAVDRADRVVALAIAKGLIMKFGQRRGVKYRLTNSGLAKAESLAEELTALIA